MLEPKKIEFSYTFQHVRGSDRPTDLAALLVRVAARVSEIQFTRPAVTVRAWCVPEVVDDHRAWFVAVDDQYRRAMDENRPFDAKDETRWPVIVGSEPHWHCTACRGCVPLAALREDGPGGGRLPVANAYVCKHCRPGLTEGGS